MPPEHLFISYAWANAAFVDWLSMRLTAEGYKVWVDRHKILGGQNWVKMIDNAIKEQSCRLLGVLSQASVAREAPQNEWLLAMKLAKDGRAPEFFIPLLLDPLEPKDLPFNLGSTQYVPFHESWGAGLNTLLDHLQSQGVVGDKRAVSAEFDRLKQQRRNVQEKREVLWSNELQLTKYPNFIFLFEVADGSVTDGWIARQHSENRWWAFSSAGAPVGCKLTRSVNWREEASTAELKPRDVFVALANKHFEAHCRAIGLQRSPYPQGEYLYVPRGLLANDEVKFTTYNGSATHKLLVGTRTKKRLSGDHETYHYHIAPELEVRTPMGDPVLSVNLRVYLTDADGHPLKSKLIVSRRKTVCRSWFNHEWLSTLLAVRELLFGETAKAASLSDHFHVGPLRKFEAGFGLDDAKITPAEEEEEEDALYDEDGHEEDEAEDAHGQET